MLETIRDFASERLETWGEAQELRRRDAEHFLALTEEAEPHLPAYQREWVDRLEIEHDTLRLLRSPQVLRRDAACPASCGISVAVLAGEGPPVGRPASPRGRARCRRTPDGGPREGSRWASMTVIDTTSRLHAEEGLALHRALGDAWGTAHSQLALASAVAGDDMAMARLLYDESARAFRELGDEHYALIATPRARVGVHQPRRKGVGPRVARRDPSPGARPVEQAHRGDHLGSPGDAWRSGRPDQ